MNRNYTHGPIYGKITDNADPESMGRVKVMVDHLGETIETGWIPVLTPVPGMFILPEISDQVVVSFIGDSPDQGVVLGTVWSSTQMPPETAENTASDLNKDGENNLRFFHSRTGHKIILDDKAGEEKIQMITGDGGTRYEFKAKEETLSLTTDKDLIISAATKLSITGEEAEIIMTKGFKITGETVTAESTGKDVTIKAGKNVGVEASGINLN